MSKLLRGNFETRNHVRHAPNGEDLETRFERAALAKLGGSIAYVSRKKFLWDGEGEGDGAAKEMSAAGRASQYDRD